MFMNAADVPDHAIRFCISDIHHPLQVRQYLSTNDQTLPESVWKVTTAEDIDRAAAALEDMTCMLWRAFLSSPSQNASRPNLNNKSKSKHHNNLSALSGIIAGLLLLSDQLIYRVLSALMIHVHHARFADGYLARLKGVESKFDIGSTL